MKIRKTVMALMCILVCTSAAAAANTITISDVTALPDEETMVVVSLSNTEPVYALQLKIQLPADADITVVNGSESGLARAAGHSVTAGLRENVLTMMVYSTSMEPIEAGEGAIARFGIKTGQKPFALTMSPTVKATDALGNTLECAAETFSFTNLTANAVLGSETMDFGRVPIFGEYGRQVSVYNSGTAPLTISGVRFSAATLSVRNVMPMTVAPGESAYLDIRYAPQVRGEVTETAVLECNSLATRNLVEISANPYAVNEIAVVAASGISGEEVTVPITLSNMDPITGFTLEFNLPAALEYVEGSFALSEERVADHQLVATTNGKTLKAVCYSLSDTPFAGTDGELATMRVRLKSRYGTSLAPTKAVLAAKVDGKIENVTSDIYSGYISISAPQISVGRSMTMGRTPVTETAIGTLNVRNYGSAPLTISRIIIDKGGGCDAELSLTQQLPITIDSYNRLDLAIECGDLYEGSLAGTIQIYCNDPDSELVNVTLSGERYAPNFMTGSAREHHLNDGTAWLDLSLSNYDAIRGLQFDVSYNAEHFTALDEAEFTARADGFSMQQRVVSPGVSRYFIYSLSGNEILPGEGEIVRLPFRFDNTIPEGEHPFSISGMKLSTETMANKNSALEPHNFSLLVAQDSQTGMALTEAFAEAIKVIGNDLLIDGIDEDVSVSVYTSAGILVNHSQGSVKVSNLDRGIYIVVIGKTSRKVMI